MAATLLLKTTTTQHPCMWLCLKAGGHWSSSPTGLLIPAVQSCLLAQ